MDTSVQEHYNRWHIEYLKYYGDAIQAHRPSNINDLYEYLYKSLDFHDGESVVDAGSGVCGPAVFFAKNSDIKIFAVNFSTVQNECAKNKISEYNLNNSIHIVEGDYNMLPELFPGLLFDVVYFLESFGHSVDHCNTMQSAFSVLKVGGRLYIKDYFLLPLSDDIGKRTLQEIGIKNMKKVYHYNIPDKQFVLHYAKSLGFRNLFMRTPNFKLDNEAVVNAFEAENGIDLFEGNDKPPIIEPLEMMFVKF